MPDWFRGKPINEDMLGNREGVMAWLGKVGTYEVVRKSKVPFFANLPRQEPSLTVQYH